MAKPVPPSPDDRKKSKLRLRGDAWYRLWDYEIVSRPAKGEPTWRRRIEEDGYVSYGPTVTQTEAMLEAEDRERRENEEIRRKLG